MQSEGSSASFGRTLMSGLRAGNLYAGAMSPLLGAMLHNATLFYVNGAARALLYNPQVHQPRRDAFIAGATVGAAATIVETPIDLIKCKLQVSSQRACRVVAHSHLLAGDESVFQRVCGSAPRVCQLWNSRPVAGRGRDGPAQRAVLQRLLWHEHSGQGVLFQQQQRRAAAALPVVSLGFDVARSRLSLLTGPSPGAAAGFGFWGVLYPLDVVKSRMQVQSSVRSERKYKSVLHCFRTIYKEEGAHVSTDTVLLLLWFPNSFFSRRCFGAPTLRLSCGLSL